MNLFAIKNSITLILVSIVLSSLISLDLGTKASAQESGVVVTNTLYRSEVDEQLTVRKISLLPVTDNVSGIYARPVEKYLSKLIEENHKFDFVEASAVGPILSPNDLMTSPQRISEISRSIEADAFMVCKITKGPQGLSIHLQMYLTSDQRLFAEAKANALARFQVADLNEKVKELSEKVLSKLPYSGLVLSRQGKRVTVNLGIKNGITEGEVVNVIQVIKANRHPKFGFLINTEKEILGKVKLLKVDQTLSFGNIITEREKGAIQKDAKINNIDFVNYTNTDSLTNDNTTAEDLQGRADGLIAFGKGPKEWLPKKPPTFGRVGAKLSLGMFNGNMQLTSETLEAENPYYPSVEVNGELWLTSDVSLHASLQQGIISFDNPRSGSQPSELTGAMSKYEFMGGYNFRMGPDIWGPKVELLAGFLSYSLRVDDSNPQALTSMTYTGFKLGLHGSYPVTSDRVWHAGAKMFFVFEPNLVESPDSSGTSSNTVNQFGGFVLYRLGVNLMASADLDFELYSSSFSGATASATSSSQKHVSLGAGIHYLF